MMECYLRGKKVVSVQTEPFLKNDDPLSRNGKIPKVSDMQEMKEALSTDNFLPQTGTINPFVGSVQNLHNFITGVKSV